MGKDTVHRHQTYIEALKTEGVEFIAGNFKNKQLNYKNNHLELKWKKHEEKETDVNISIFMVRDAMKKSFDEFFLITNDTDILPAIKMARNENINLRFKLLTPPTLNPHDSLLDSIQPGETKKLTEGHIQNSLFPMFIKKQNSKIIHIPEQFKPS